MSKFMDCKAPMTAKCVILSYLSEVYPQGPEEQYSNHTVEIINALAEHGYVIVSKEKTTTRGRRK